MAVLWLLGPVLTPFVAAAILAYVLEPGVRRLAAAGVPRALAVLLVLLLALAAIVAIVLILVPIVREEAALIRSQLPGLVVRISDELLPWLRERFGIEVQLDAQGIRQWLARHLADSGQDLAALAFAYVRSGWQAAAQVLGLLFLVPVAVFYLLLDWPLLIERARALVPPRWRAPLGGFLHETDDLLGHYLRGQLLVMACLAAYYSLALLVGGFKLWLAIGTLTGLLIAIPYLGFALGAAFALVAGMLELGPLKGLLIVAVVYGIGQVVESLLLTPRLVGERIGLHPLAVIFALLAFGALFGFVGVLLALPLSAIAAVGLRRLRTAWIESEFYRRRT